MFGTVFWVNSKQIHFQGVKYIDNRNIKSQKQE
jgi:hypothetical protein